MPPLGGLEMVVALFDLVDRRRFLRSRAGGFGHLPEIALGAAHPLGRGPQSVRVDVGELADERRVCGILRAGGEVTGAHTHPGSSAVEPDLAETDQVEVSVRGRELLGHVGGEVMSTTQSWPTCGRRLRADVRCPG